MEKEFAVDSKSFELLTAVKLLADKRGWVFTPGVWQNLFTEERWMADGSRYKRRLHFQKDYKYTLNNSSCPGAYGLDNVYYLPKDWDVVEKLLSESIKVDINVELGNSCKAVVTPTEVKVGCQTFQFDRIKELYEAIHSPKSSTRNIETKWMRLFLEDASQRWVISGSDMYPIFFDSKEEVKEDSETLAIKVELPTYPSRTVKLNVNPKYDARIISDKVVVDSNVFSFDVVDKLYEAVLKQKQ